MFLSSLTQESSMLDFTDIQNRVLQNLKKLDSMISVTTLLHHTYKHTHIHIYIIFVYKVLFTLRCIEQIKLATLI